MNDGEFILSILTMLKTEKGNWIDLSDDGIFEEDYTFRYFVSEKSEKKYLFYWDDTNPAEQLNKVDILIERAKAFNFIPQNTYLILFSNFETTEEIQYKEIIMVEENEFRFKKYVCYYTQKELADLRENSSEIITDKIWMDSSLLNKSDAYNLLYRIIIKIPFIKMNFQREELEGFDSIYKNIRESGKKITEGFEAEQIMKMEKIVLQNLPENRETIKKHAEEFTNNFIRKVFGEDIDEYLSE